MITTIRSGVTGKPEVEYPTTRAVAGRCADNRSCLRHLRGSTKWPVEMHSLLAKLGPSNRTVALR
jgi:hypothetical protein